MDLPMPGAPPTSTREPWTAPPPSTRSSSFMPVWNRSSRVVSTSSISLGLDLPCRSPAVAAAMELFRLVSAGCSTMVFHALQAGHWPAHLGSSLPHSVQ